MKTPKIDSNLLIDTDATQRRVVAGTAVTDFQYQPAKDSNAAKISPTAANKVRPQLTTFRALSRQVFGPSAAREYVAEAILFVWMMVVAAWPLGVTLNQLGTMYIAPPNALW